MARRRTDRQPPWPWRMGSFRLGNIKAIGRYFFEDNNLERSLLASLQATSANHQRRYARLHHARSHFVRPQKETVSDLPNDPVIMSLRSDRVRPEGLSGMGLARS